MTKMPDCRFILDNISDYSALQGELITGSAVADISSAELRAGDSSWIAKVATVNPALQHPAAGTTVALYLDTDGRFENNAASGVRLGTDQVYSFISQPDGSWRTEREAFDTGSGGFVSYRSDARLSVEPKEYVISIPFGELPKDAKAYWRVGTSWREGGRVTADFAPDSGFSCTTALATVREPLLPQVKALVMGWPGKIALWAVVVLALAVIFWKKKRKI